jgi:hypothetical protein
VKHSTDKYYPFEDKVFDLWLCKNYWNSIKWDMPVDGSLRDEIGKCSFYCGHSSHKESNSFCTKNAWHLDDHVFDCKHEGSYDATIIDIVFCCDTTGSMGGYIEKSKTTIKKIVQTAKESKRSVKFGFVAYRDHPPQDTSYVTRLNDLTDDCSLLSFLGTVTADGGGDGPESVLDGLNDSINKMSWRPESLRYIFHIADAPPHGREYTGGVGDGFPSGCPCGLRIETLASSLKTKNIRYKLLKIGTYANTMATVFKSKIENYEESNLDSPIQLETKVSDMIIRDWKTDEFDFIDSKKI